MNLVVLVGRLGQDPEIRLTAGGTQVANLSLATNEAGQKDQNGQREVVTEWHKVTLWGKTAEIAGQYLKKGSLCMIRGKIQTRKWQDQQGNDRYSTEIIANEMQLMGGSDNQGQMQKQAPVQQPQQSYQQPAQQPPAQMSWSPA